MSNVLPIVLYNAREWLWCYCIISAPSIMYGHKIIFLSIFEWQIVAQICQAIITMCFPSTRFLFDLVYGFNVINRLFHYGNIATECLWCFHPTACGLLSVIGWGSVIYGAVNSYLLRYSTTQQIDIVILMKGQCQTESVFCLPILFVLSCILFMLVHRLEIEF